MVVEGGCSSRGCNGDAMVVLVVGMLVAVMLLAAVLAFMLVQGAVGLLAVYL